MAFDLLQEALISKWILALKTGGGIGHVLIYLIKDGFIDADLMSCLARNMKKYCPDLKKQGKTPGLTGFDTAKLFDLP